LSSQQVPISERCSSAVRCTACSKGCGLGSCGAGHGHVYCTPSTEVQYFEQAKRQSMHDTKKTDCPLSHLTGGGSETLILTFESEARFLGAHACHLALDPKLTPLLTKHDRGNGRRTPATTATAFSALNEVPEFKWRSRKRNSLRIVGLSVNLHSKV
jgi:hypothetical protein